MVRAQIARPGQDRGADMGRQEGQESRRLHDVADRRYGRAEVTGAVGEVAVGADGDQEPAGHDRGGEGAQGDAASSEAVTELGPPAIRAAEPSSGPMKATSAVCSDACPPVAIV